MIFVWPLIRSATCDACLRCVIRSLPIGTGGDNPSVPATGLRQRGKDTSRSKGRSGRQNAATRRSTRRAERVTVQGPVKKQQPDGMSHGGGGGLMIEPYLMMKVGCLTRCPSVVPTHFWHQQTSAVPQE